MSEKSMDIEYMNTLEAEIRRLKHKLGEISDVVFSYGGVDGGHHKQYGFNQIVHILTDCQKVMKTADYRGNPYQYETYEENAEYKAWVEKYEERDADGNPEYEWDKGICP